MKTASYLIITTTLVFANPSLHAQEVALGGITFDAASDAADATWYDPMNPGKATVLQGFGALAGKTRTITYSAGGVIAGVKTIRRSSVEKSIGEVTEEMWIAFDSANDARVLKIVRAGELAYEATTNTAPPLYLPSLPVDGQTWDLGGTTVTVAAVIASNSGTCLKITYTAPGAQAESRFLRVGDGIIYIEAGTDSGWKPRPAGITP